MNKTGRAKVRSIFKAYREACRGVASIGSHLTLVRQSLRETHEAERELNDALAARVMALEVNVESGANSLNAEWDAIERGKNSAAQKQIALRLLFKNLAAQFQRLKRQAKPSERTAPTSAAAAIVIPISAGDLIDRLTLVEIHIARASDATQLTELQRDYEILLATLVDSLPPSEALNALRAQLKDLNEARRRIETELHECETADDFGSTFVSSARTLMRVNADHADLKRRIDAHSSNATIAQVD
jgi:hypothetical protein